MRNYLADYDLIAVSANHKEEALNTEQDLDTSLLVAKTDLPAIEPRTEDNKDELTGKEEPDTVYKLGALSSMTMNFEKAQAQHFAFGLAYALGVSTPAAHGTGYKHTITPTPDLFLPSFTLAARYGKVIAKRRLASMHVDQFAATFAKDSWAKLVLTLKGTGKYTDSITKETVEEAYNAASLTLAANAVAGADAAARLDNVHQIRALIPNTGAYREVEFTAVSEATPAVITITPPTPAALEELSKAEACVVKITGHGLINGDKITIAGIEQAEWSALNAEHEITKLTDDTFSIPVDTSEFVADYVPETDPGTGVCSTITDFEVLYAATEAAWMTFPARVTEPPLRVTDVVFTLGGKWNGTDFVGGRSMSDEIESVEYSINNNLAVEFRMGGTGDYANYALRQGRAQVLKLTRQMREFILQQKIMDGEYFGVRLTATGAEYETGKNYAVDIVFPRCAVLQAPVSVSGKVLAEAGDLVVLEDDTYGSVIATVTNKVEGYAQEAA